MSLQTSHKDQVYQSDAECVTDCMRSFFSEGSVIDSFMAIIKHRNDQSDDPFSDLMILSISAPFSVSLNECGFTPFRVDPTIIIPYHSMTREQLECMKRCCEFFEASGRYISSVQIGGGLYVGNLASHERDQKYHIDPAIILFGCNVILRTCLRHTHKNLFDPARTEGDHGASEYHTPPRTPHAPHAPPLAPQPPDPDKWEEARLRDICNVILQRILAAVLVSTDRIAAAERMCAQYFQTVHEK